MMSFIGYRWYPEYTVEEQFLDFNQTQFHCTVRIYPHHIGVSQPFHFWAWHWCHREHGCAGCCIFMHYTAERGACTACRITFPLYPCCTSRRRGILHQIVHRSLPGGYFASDHFSARL